MTQKYNYSFDLSSVFQQEEQEAVETPSTGLVPKPQAKPAETTDDSIDPMGFMPKFTEFMGATYNRAIQRHQDKTPNRSLYKDRAFEEFLGGNSDIGSLLAPATGTEINPNPIVPNPPKVTVKPMHKVASGDTLSKIAKANNTTVSAILQNNPDIKNPNKINVGQDIILPSAEPEEVATPATPATTAEATPAAEPEATTEAATTSTELETYTNDFALDYLANHEGLVAHSSLEGGKDTAALGVKFSLGLKRADYTSDEEFAAAVALKHKDKAKAKFAAGEWDKLDDSVKYALVDLNYNTGTIGSSASKGSATDIMKNTLDFVGMTTKAGEKASLISLAKRRAWNWNKAASDIGASEISKIKQIPTDSGGTKFEYLDSEGNVVHSTTTTRKPVKLNSSGVATMLTTTREVDM